MPLYEFKCFDCGEVVDKIFSSDLRPNRFKCEHCPDGEAEYQVSAPSMFRVAYDQNGRKAVKVDMGGGRAIYRSATKERWEHNAGNRSAKAYKENGTENNESVYTKEYAEVKKKEKEETERKRKALLAKIPESK